MHALSEWTRILFSCTVVSFASVLIPFYFPQFTGCFWCTYNTAVQHDLWVQINCGMDNTAKETESITWTVLTLSGSVRYNTKCVVQYHSCVILYFTIWTNSTRHLKEFWSRKLAVRRSRGRMRWLGQIIAVAFWLFVVIRPYFHLGPNHNKLSKSNGNYLA